MVSYFNFLSAQSGGVIRSEEDFYSLYNRSWGTWGENFGSWYDQRQAIKIMFVSYESLKKDTAIVLSEILRFCGEEVDLDRVNYAVERSNMGSMREMPGQSAFMKSRKKNMAFVGNKNVSLDANRLARELQSCRETVLYSNEFYGSDLRYRGKKNSLSKLYRRAVLKVKQLFSALQSRV